MQERLRHAEVLEALVVGISQCAKPRPATSMRDRLGNALGNRHSPSRDTFLAGLDNPHLDSLLTPSSDGRC